MKILGKGRVKYTAYIIKTLYAGTVVKARGEAIAPDPETIEAGTKLDVVGFDKDLQTITVITGKTLHQLIGNSQGLRPFLTVYIAAS